MSDDDVRIVLDVRDWPDEVVAVLERESHSEWSMAWRVRRALDLELDERLKRAGDPRARKMDR